VDGLADGVVVGVLVGGVLQVSCVVQDRTRGGGGGGGNERGSQPQDREQRELSAEPGPGDARIAAGK
jgi:hypothetical protein